MRRCGVLILLISLTLTTGCTTARQKCKAAVIEAYMDADKVLQQPIDLDGYCAAWDNHPPGIDPPAEGGT